MAKKSNRNRHTGRVNAFKSSLLKHGKAVEMSDRNYKVSGGYITGISGNRIEIMGTAVRV